MRLKTTLLAVALCAPGGCQFSLSFGTPRPPGGTVAPAVPKETQKATQSAYIIEPPDILVVNAYRALPERPIIGERLVRSDGTINLNYYGTVRVAGLTLDQAKTVIEDHLAAFIKNPRIDLDVFSYNSKFYYVLADGAGFGEQAVRLPFTGNETVLDAITQIGGLPPVSSKKRIWLSRPGSGGAPGGVMMVDWIAITQCGDPSTNYQIYPGDRIYIGPDPLINTDGFVSKLLAPIERLFGVTLLGAETIKRLQNMGRDAGGGGGGGF